MVATTDRPRFHTRQGREPYIGTANQGLIMVPAAEVENFGITPEQIQRDFDNAGFYPQELYRVHLVEYQGNYLPAHYEVGMQYGSSKVLAHVGLELGYTDGVQYDWDSRVFIFPEYAVINGQAVPIPPMIQEMGYHVVRRNPPTSLEPLVRIDSLCATSMIDGHYASAGESGLGCDCAPQRHIVQQLIQRSNRGGFSILSPMSGRGNGTFVHTGQLAQQNFAARHNLPIPPTYHAHEKQGFVSDSRDKYYGIDALILRSLFPPEFTNPSVLLFTNNPQKIEAVAAMDIRVTPVAVHDPSRYAYYAHSVNFKDKAEAGGHTPMTSPIDVDAMLEILNVSTPAASGNGNGNGNGNGHHG